MGFTKFTKNVLNISGLPDRVQNKAATLKALFDQAGVDIKDALNGLIAELEASTGAGNIGANVPTVTTKTVQAILTAFEESILDRYTKGEIDALVSGNTNNLVEDVDINLTTGVITVTKKDGTVEKYDTAIEKVPAKFEITQSGNTYYLKITNVDGTSTQTDITKLMNIYEFNNTNDIAFTVEGTGNKKTVKANIRANSIGLDKLSVSVVSTLEGYMNSAKDSANSAKTSENSARNSAETARKAAEVASEGIEAGKTAVKKATEAESYAHGGTGTRENEDRDNAKYYSQVAKEVAGGNFVTVTEMETYAQKKGTVPSFEGEVVSGEEIEVDVPVEVESVLHISGNSEQNSRSGKNKFDLLESAISGGDMRTVVNSSTLKITTQNTAGYSYCILGIPNSEKLLGKTCTLSVGSAVPSASNKWQLALYEYNTSGLGARRMLLNDTNYTKENSVTVTLPSAFSDGAVRFVLTIYANAGGTASVGDYVTYTNIQLEEGSTATSYEPYGVQPSPDYPSEIRSVKSKSDNLFDGILELGIFSGDKGSAVANAEYTRCKNFIPVDSNTDYTFSSSDDTDWYCIYEYDENYKYVLTNNKVTANTFKTNSTTKYIRFRFGNKNTDITKIAMLNKGTEALPYQPYGYVPVEFKVEGKNLLKKDKNFYKTRTEFGIDFTVNEDESVTINGTNNGQDYSKVFLVSRDTEPLTLSAGIYNSKTTGMSDVRLIGQTATGYVRFADDKISSFALEKDTIFEQIYLQVHQGATTTFNNFTVYPIITKASNSVEPYEPYKGKTISLPLGDIELRSTPDGTRDTFARVDGVWNKVGKIENTIFVGNNDEGWKDEGNQKFDDTFYFLSNGFIRQSTAVKESSLYCNRFIQRTIYSVNQEGVKIEGGSNEWNLRIRVNRDRLATQDVAGFKTWLSSNPMEVVWQLKTPTYTPITDQGLISALDELEELILHKGYNHITVTAVNGVKAYLDLEIPATASVTNVVETDVPHELIIPAVTGEGDVKVKIPTENKMTINPATGEVNVKALKIDGVDITTFIEQVVAKLGT